MSLGLPKYFPFAFYRCWIEWNPFGTNGHLVLDRAIELNRERWSNGQPSTGTSVRTGDR